MKIHEYQAKELFNKYNIPIPKGDVAFSTNEAKVIAGGLNGFPVVIKAQIHAGGRGKGGGVKIAGSLDEVHRIADEIIGMTLITHQTGPEGKEVKKILVEEGLNIEKELYLSIVPDRATASFVVMASEAGGMDIEEVADKTPEKIIKVYIDPLLGIQPYHCRQVAYGLKLIPSVMKQFVPMLTNMYKLFIDYDCALLEINPLVITAEETVKALDAKIDIDDNSLFRHKDILKYRDIDEEEPLEAEAFKFNLNYIKMDGNVGNMVNGAGLAMATMDIIKNAGAEPANFLDVGGGASVETVENGFRIILRDKNVKGIFVNVFGGILRCDILAKGIVEALKKATVNVPVVIRMQGTTADEGRKILSESGINPIFVEDLNDAAQKVAQIVGA